ncbi:hypothetical protein OEZ85_000607 [Tetradesmus obliquus]|uniref:Uncharacterized protein n=1 Tax=Tetradesmus obliquus TaxID=3088 RepID=A0ABY8UMA3_TETOB|nr:hypothetical protein OEZ85_000607 [Tetradesmus obliquus]
MGGSNAIILSSSSSSSRAGANGQLGQPSSAAAAAAAAAAGKPSAADAVIDEYFPQARRCSSSWIQEYAELHAKIRSGSSPPRFLVSVPVEAGIADRLAGMMSEFYLAMLTKRAFTTAPHAMLPGWGAVCDAPHFNWTSAPDGLLDDAVDTLKYTYKGQPGYLGDRPFPASVDRSKYAALYLVNSGGDFFATDDLTQLPVNKTEVPYLLASSNRGHTFHIAHNPHHKPTFWRHGLPAHDAFMCGFFWLCRPNAAVLGYYERYWKMLADPTALKIGIQMRQGDWALNGADKGQKAGEAMLERASRWFECAERLEKAFAAPGQKVIWFLNSDSHQFRVSAKQKFGDKLITDTDLVMWHPDCATINPEKCQRDLMDLSFVHSLGSILSFSMMDYHVVTDESGFGRLGAWLSGRWSNIYEIVLYPETEALSCDPRKPTPPDVDAGMWSGV